MSNSQIGREFLPIRRGGRFLDVFDYEAISIDFSEDSFDAPGRTPGVHDRWGVWRRRWKSRAPETAAGTIVHIAGSLLSTTDLQGPLEV